MKAPSTDFGKQHRRFRRALLAGVLLLPLVLLADRGFALNPDRSLQQYNLRTWSRQSGLPANGITAITQTRDGYLWLGTSAGLVRFDGIEFKLLDLSSVTNLTSSIVTSLASARKGGIWVGLKGGSFGFCDGQSFSFRGQTNWGGLDMNVRSIMESEDGTLWFAAENGTARLTPSGTFEQLVTSGSPTNGAQDGLCGYKDRQGRLWFGTPNRGLYYWQAGKLTKVADPALDATFIFCITEDREGQIWVGTLDGLYCLDSNLQPKATLPLDAEVRALLVDDHDVLWVGTAGRGLGRYRDGTFEFLHRADGLGSEYVNALEEDREGSLWVGTRGGVSQLTDVKFPTYPAAEDPSVRDALSVTASHQGGVWIGSPRWVTYFDPASGMRKTYGSETGIPSSYIKRVFEASNGDLYMVCYMEILAILSPQKKLVAAYTNSELVVGMAEDAHGVVVSVAGELYRAGTNYFQPYVFTNAVKPPMYWILNLASGRDGVIWVASAGGIFRVKDGSYQQWAVEETGQPVPVLWICEDNEGVVWGATMRGIVRLKDNRISFIDRKHGLLDDDIYAIVPDDFGNLWVDSNRGIFSVSRQSVNDFADGKTARVQCTVYDGMDSVKLADKTTQERVACKTSDGRIWFPSANGVVMIDPAHIPINRVAPQVHIDLVKADGQEVSRGEAITVPPGKGELEFQFDASTYIAPQKAHFRYRLEGYDLDWVDAGNRRLAFYTNLKPGTYTFQVIAANADGVWNEQGDTMKISLRPHYYQTLWFRLLCGALVLAALGGIYAERIRHLMHKQRALQKARDLLEAEVTSRTAELATANNSLQREEAQLKQRTKLLEKEIEERKRAEEELRWKTAFLEAQVNSSIDGILVVDENGKKSIQNQRVVDLFKIPPAIANGSDDAAQVKWVTDVVKNPKEFGEKITHLYSHPDEVSRDEIELKDGTILDRYSAPVIGLDRKYYGRIWTFRDITERRNIEAQLVQSQKLETVGKLAGGIAHEFNSILTAIIGQSELLLNDLPAGSPLTASATEISKAASRAALLTRQLLAYGRKQFLQPEILDLNRVVAGVGEVLPHLMGVNVVVQIVPAIGLREVKADDGQIEQVIMNIVINARDAMPNGGKLILETANVSFDAESVGRYPELKPGDYVMLAITDTGTGMSDEVKARVFEPFFSTKGIGEGTGLGLSTCYGIVKQSGGHISVYSEPGRGTTFKIYLPQVEAQTKISAQRIDSPDLPRGTETILLVEDDLALREMAATLLRRLGYAVLTAGNGIEALSLKQERSTGHIDLLFTDVVMPHMSGRELADRVRALYPQTKILFTSAYTENAIVHQGVLDKGVALLQKPFTPSALARKVREVLDQPGVPNPEDVQKTFGFTKTTDGVNTP